MSTRQHPTRSAYLGPVSNRPQVSVVESDPHTRAALVALIRTLDVDVSAYGSAEALLAILDTVGWQRGCLVVEDVRSGMGTLQLLEELRKRGVEAPAIVLANDADVPSAVRAVQSGAVDFLEKPFVPRHLLRRIREILDIREERAAGKSRHE